MKAHLGVDALSHLSEHVDRGRNQSGTFVNLDEAPPNLNASRNASIS